MKRLGLILCILALTDLLPTSSQADFLVGSQLLKECDDNTPFCAGYVLGVQDLIQVLQRQHQLGGYCPPNDLTTSQVKLTVHTYLKDNPEDLNAAAAVNTFIALFKAFPCH